MRQRKIKHKILWIAALIIYLYLLTKLILFKGGRSTLKLSGSSLWLFFINRI